MVHGVPPHIPCHSMSLTVTLNTLYNFTSSVELFTNTSRVRINRRVSVVERVEDIAAQVLLMRTAAVSLVQTGTLVGISIRCRSVPFPKPHYGSRHSSFSHYGTRTMNSGHREAPCETIAESRDLISPILIPNSVYIEANHSLVSYFPVQVNETRTTEFALGRQAREDEKKEDYYANVGDAIRTLREDIPQMFRKELDCTCCTPIYSMETYHTWLCHCCHNLCQRVFPWINCLYLRNKRYNCNFDHVSFAFMIGLKM